MIHQAASEAHLSCLAELLAQRCAVDTEEMGWKERWPSMNMIMYLSFIIDAFHGYLGPSF